MGLFDYDFVHGEQPYGAAAQVTPEQMDQLLVIARSKGLNQDQLQDLLNASSAGGSYAYILDMVGGYQRQNESTASNDRAQAEQRRGMNEYADSLGKISDRVEGDVRRYDRLMTVPGAVRADAEYGAALSAAEQGINAQQAFEDRQMTQSTASSGLRSSGRAADGSLRSQEFAAGARNRALQGTYADVAGNRREARRYGDTLQEGIGQLRLGQFPTYLSLEDRGISGRYTPNYVEGALTPGLSREAAVRGENFNTTGLVVGAAQRAADSAMNTFTQIGGMVPGN